MKDNTSACKNDEINLFDVLKYILKYRRLIIGMTAAGLLVGIVFSVASFLQGEMSKQYVIKTSIAVTSQTADGLFTSQSINPNSTDIHLAEDMVDSVIFVIRSDRTLEKAVDELNLIGITAKDIYDNLKISQYNKTQIIELSLYWRNAEEGIRILEAINHVSPKVLVDILKIGDVRVVNDPTAKYLIGGSIKASTLAAATMAGFIMGLIIAICIMFLRPTLISSEDAENRLGLTMIGEIPKDRHYPAKGTVLPDRTAELSREVIDHFTSASHVLRKSMDKASARMIYITSAAEAEGKTSVAAGLGMQLAEQEKRVLLIDMNTVSPKLGGLFVPDVDSEHTLNAVCRGDIDLSEAVITVNGYLHILPLMQEESEVLMSRSTLSMLRDFADSYDYAIIDTASIGDSANILKLNEISDGAVFVIRYDDAPMSVISDALTRLKNTEIPVLGCVVNQTTKLS